MRDLFGGMSRPVVAVLAVLSAVGAFLAAASTAAMLYVGYYFLRDPKLAADGANGVPTLIYIGVPALVALIFSAALFARGCCRSIRHTPAGRP